MPVMPHIGPPVGSRRRPPHASRRSGRVGGTILCRRVASLHDRDGIHIKAASLSADISRGGIRAPRGRIPMATMNEAAKRPAPAAAFAALGERLREIGTTAAAPEDMFDPALAAIVQATGVAGAAICLYDPAHELLRLAAEFGLSDEGCRRLRTVRRNDPTSWDMPLQGLLNRRVYLIESASRNRYVPPLVEPATSV